jgi:curli biogenesis system outer membrane secretion channel CsgG
LKVQYVVAAAACAVLLSGCGTTITKDASYKDVMELRDAYIAAGVVKEPKCEDKPTQDAKADQGWQATTCGANTVLVTFDNTAALNKMVAQDVKFKKDREAVLSGPNWTVRGPELEIKDLQAKLGGKLQ